MQAKLLQALHLRNPCYWVFIIPAKPEFNFERIFKISPTLMVASITKMHHVRDFTYTMRRYLCIRIGTDNDVVSR